MVVERDSARDRGVILPLLRGGRNGVMPPHSPPNYRHCEPPSFGLDSVERCQAAKQYCAAGATALDCFAAKGRLALTAFLPSISRKHSRLFSSLIGERSSRVFSAPPRLGRLRSNAPARGTLRF